ncbi:MAG: hypothetical protein HY701_12725 [Gemmatimonadetes bacterium]|nr:hypothetical protein [Gemmatimonadota bacterium]
MPQRPMHYAVQRVWTWMLASVLALAVVAWVAPQQVSVLVYKLAQVTFAITVAYWADRTLFRFAPAIERGMPRDQLSAARVIARALIVLAILVGFTIGI